MTSHQQIAELFAIGRTKVTGSRMFIDGDVVYSYGYHFPIAKRHFKDGVDYLFNPADYSNSTSRHKSYVWQELSGEVLQVKDCNIENATEQYEHNKKQMVYLTQKMRRARTRKNYYNEQIEYLKSQNEILSKFAVTKKLLVSVGQY